MLQQVILPFTRPNINLLDQWATRIRVIKSEQNPVRSIHLSDERLNGIVEFFRDFFGDEFFLPEPAMVNIPYIKVKDSHYFLQLLVNDDYQSLLHVFEIEYVLKKTKQILPHLYRVLQINKESQAFRNYLFEAIIYCTLSDNQVEYDAKQVVDDREKEGFLYINSIKMLFECKKLYTYQMPGIDFITNIYTEFFKLWIKRPMSMNGYISIKETTEPKARKAKNIFRKTFTDYFKRVKKTNDVNYTEKLKNEEDTIIGEVIFENYNRGIFENYVTLIPDSNISFMIKPPEPTQVNEMLMHIHNTRILFRFKVSEADSVKSLIKDIDKKRQSQNKIKDMPRIFFFDNEMYRGTEFGLFNRSVINDDTAIQQYVDSKNTDDIICLVFRSYTKGSLPHWYFKVYCKPSLDRYKEVIINWTLLYKQPDFFDYVPKYIGPI